MKKISLLFVFLGAFLFSMPQAFAIDAKGFLEFKPENKEVRQSLIDNIDPDLTQVVSDAQTKKNGEPKIKKIRRVSVNGEFRDAGDGLIDGIIAIQRASEPRYDFTVDFDAIDFNAACAGINKREDLIIDSVNNRITINRNEVDVVLPVGPITIRVKSRNTNNGQRTCQFTVTGDFARGVDFEGETTLIDQLGSFLLKTSRRAVQVVPNNIDEPPDDDDPPGNGGDGNDAAQLEGPVAENPDQLGGTITFALQNGIPAVAQEFMDALGAQVDFTQQAEEEFSVNDSGDQFVPKFVQEQEEGDNEAPKELFPYFNISETIQLISADPAERTAFLNGLAENFFNFNEPGTEANEPSVQGVIADNQTTTAEYLGSGPNPSQGIFAISTSGFLISIDQTDPTGNSDAIIGSFSTQNFRAGVRVCPDGEFLDPETKTCLIIDIDDDQGSGGLASGDAFRPEPRKKQTRCPDGMFPTGFDEEGFVRSCLSCDSAGELNLNRTPDECLE